MARKKLSEFRAKQLLFSYLDTSYHGIPVLGPTEQELKKLEPLNKTENFVVKVDQGVKKRGKQRLIAVGVSPYKIKHILNEFAQKGYSQFLIERFIPHERLDEKYFALERTREGIKVYMSQLGGVDIEENQEKIETRIIKYELSDKESKVIEVSVFLGLDKEIIKRIIGFFEEQYISFLEINPLIVKESSNLTPSPLLIGEGDQGQVFVADLAVEVDSSGEFFVKDGWTSRDFVEDSGHPPATQALRAGARMTEEEKSVRQLKENSQASLKLDVLNPNGSIFTMLSGGGASITLADEAYNQGYGKELANYADYSGNPNQEETYLYTKQLLSLLLKSRSHKKAIIIAGGVANFTDVRITFRGILQALKEQSDNLQKQQVKIFVRRAGPNQQEGLKMMSDFLMQDNLYGGVWDQTMVLTDVVNKAIEYVK